MIKQGYDKLNIVNADGEGRVFKLDAYGWLDDFEILSEEDEEIDIDIDKIKELDYCLEELEKPSYEESWLMNCIRANKDKLNELTKAVKLLNKKIKE